MEHRHDQPGLHEDLVRRRDLAHPSGSLDLDPNALEGLCQPGELGEGRRQIFNDLGGDDAGGGEAVGVFEALGAGSRRVAGADLGKRESCVTCTVRKPL